MAKIILDFEQSKNIKQNDVIVFNGRHYITISRAAFLKDLIENNYRLFKKVEYAEKRISDLEKQLRIDHGEE